MRLRPSSDELELTSVCRIEASNGRQLADNISQLVFVQGSFVVGRV